MQKKVISVIGMGKLGLPLALLYAENGYRVIGYDIVKSSIEKLQQGISPISEEGVQRLLTSNRKRLSFTSQIADIAISDITFIVVPTPSNTDGSFSPTHIVAALNSFGPYLRKKKSHHTVVVTSTVSPGTMDGVLKPLLQKLTEKKIGVDLGLCYSPELIALGSVIHDMRHPDFLFIGQSDVRSGNEVQKIRKGICKNAPPVVQTNWINVELAKLSLNAYITTKISFANMVARICERTPQADSEVVLQTIGLDSRIGRKYLKGGLGYGGPCFPRDTLSLAAAIKTVHLDIRLPQVIHEFNEDQVQYVLELVARHTKQHDVVGILGLGYKQGTDVIDESQGVLLLKKLLSRGVKVVAYDPLAMENTKKRVSAARFADSLEKCIQMSDIVILTTQTDDFKDIRWDRYEDKVVIDCWRIINLAKQNKKRNTFIQLGTHLSA